MNKKPSDKQSDASAKSAPSRPHPKPAKRLSVYANLANKRRLKKDKRSREKAEYLASLPKHPVKRFFYRLHPKRVFRYWFSKRGGLMVLKILGVAIVVMIILIGGLFAYFRKDLDKIRPGELAKRVQTTVTKYYDRNGALLWEDKGTDNYKLVVEADKISDYLKKATIAIEDRDFYKHHGISVSGLTRAMFSTASGRQVQGGSTLTQQLVKQVFFADDADKRGLSGIPRKIKEIILAIEVERMYNKEQILTLYLNQAPYGGRRNGAESAAQTYFGKSAKDLTLAEAALLASIPQNPSTFNPYNIAGRKMLLSRQHTTLDYMLEQGYITEAQAKEAKQYPILDKIKPETEQLAGIKAPHFVLMVRNQLERELGKAVVGRGGLTVKTTLDWRIQEKLETEMKAFFDSGRPGRVRISNGAATVEDAQTGQIVALVGSRDFNYAGFGQDNAATAFIQPGSTIKAFDYAKLFENRGSNQQNYGSGSILSDENIDKIYGAKLNNWDRRFMGSISIRRSLALSRNIPAVKAMYIAGNGSPKPTVDYIHNMGNTNYCQQEEAAGGYGLSAAIGACGTKQTELVNAYGTFARMGVAKPSTNVLEVTNSQGDTLKKWKDESKQATDPQVAYIINDILGDADAARDLHGYGAMNVPGVRTAAKTGTTDKNGHAKDVWIVNYSPALVMGMWLGNSDTSTINTPNSAFGMPVVRNVMSFAHNEVYTKQGKWKPNDWFKRPNGIQQQGKELYPSWWNKKQGETTEKIKFDRVSKKKATNCTPADAIEEIEVTKTIDPLTKKPSYSAPEGYDANADDDKHKCDDAKPSVSLSLSGSGSSRTITARATNGTFPLTSIDILVDGHSVKSESISGSGGSVSVGVQVDKPGRHIIQAIARDEGYYTASDSGSFSVGSGSSSD
ncbi:penicillin-binding protein [Candidatus Saccharibacteria bacterium oral taxon 488]|nr:penicillin-binding protein [Candidatus Saccharibacteria bacterium oral taxon 488]